MNSLIAHNFNVFQKQSYQLHESKIVHIAN